jgi:phosphatidylglycerophosphate synthase
MAMSVDELRRIAQAGKDTDPAWYRVHRRLSIHLTRVALAMGLAPNHVSIAMMVIGIAGAVLLSSLDRTANVVGFVLFYVAFLLDKVDGELARLLGRASGRGIFLDRLYHRLVEPSMFIGVAVHEYRITGWIVVLVAGFATVALANAIEENQHLAAYIAYKRVREGAEIPLVSESPSGAWALLAGAFRPLKGFRMLIVGLPLFLLYYVAEWATGVAVPTLGLVASAIGLAIYLAFQCTYYFFERLDAEMSSVTETFRGAARTTRRDS